MIRPLLPLLLVASAAPAAAAPADEAKQALAGQVNAWNGGDLEAALAAYWDSPEMLWVNQRGVERGFAAFADAMRKDYPSGTKGIFTSEILESRSLSPHAALIVVRWAIEEAGKRQMGGVSTQLWERRGGRWRITLEHAS